MSFPSLADDPSGKNWESFLMCESVDEAIKAFPGDEPEESDEAVNVVSRCYYRLAGLHAGLDRPAIVAYRKSLESLRRAMIRLAKEAAESAAVELWKEDIEMFPEDEELKSEDPFKQASYSPVRHSDWQN